MKPDPPSEGGGAGMPDYNGNVLTVGKFHQRCAKIIILSEDRQIASGVDHLPSCLRLCILHFRMTQFWENWSFQWRFSIMALGMYVSSVHPPYLKHQMHLTPAGGAVHVVDCCLFFVQSGFWYLLSAAAAYCHQLLMAMIPPCTPVGGNGQFVARIRVRYKQQWQ